MELYDIVCILGNMFSAYLIYQFMRIPYSACRVKFWVEVACYGIFFVVVTLTQFILKLSVFLLLVNLLSLFLLALLYDRNIRKAMLTAVYFYFTFFLIEVAVVMVLGHQTALLTLPDHNSSVGVVITRLLSLILIRWMKGFKRLKNNMLLPGSYWVSLLVVPSGSGILLITIFAAGNVPRAVSTLCIVAGFLINIVSFYLYDTIAGMMQKEMEQFIAEEKNRFYEQEIKLMKDSLEGMRMYRHDLKNKLSPLYTLAKNGENEELIKHLSELTEILDRGREYARSDNLVIDGIINYKLRQAESCGIRVTTEILIPANLEVATFDIAVILGNLLDNAIEAVQKVEVKERWIDIKIKYTKGRLIIEIRNAYDGILLMEGGSIVSSKMDCENHGLGLHSVETTLQKYAGVLQLSGEEAGFRAKALLYV